MRLAIRAGLIQFLPCACRSLLKKPNFPLLVLFKIFLMASVTEHFKIQTTVFLSCRSDPSPQTITVWTRTEEFGDGLRSLPSEESHTP